MKILHLDLKLVGDRYAELRFFWDNPNNCQSRQLPLAEITDLIQKVDTDYYTRLPEDYAKIGLRRTNEHNSLEVWDNFVNTVGWKQGEHYLTYNEIIQQTTVETTDSLPSLPVLCWTKVDTDYYTRLPEDYAKIGLRGTNEHNSLEVWDNFVNTVGWKQGEHYLTYNDIIQQTTVQTTVETTDSLPSLPVLCWTRFDSYYVGQDWIYDYVGIVF